MKYFKNITCIEDLKMQYRELTKRFHPDLGGSTAAMQEINNEYTALFDRYKNIYRNMAGEAYTTSSPTDETAEDFINIINAVIGFAGIKIELIGRWIWVFGETLPYREQFKKLGFKWNSKKLAWTWHFEEDGKRSKRRFSIDEIRAMYGSQEIETRETVQIH